MDKLFQERRKKLKIFKSFIHPRKERKPIDVPEDLYIKCPNCEASILTKELHANLDVCSCGYHFKFGAYKRLDALFDQGAYKVLFDNLGDSNPLDFPGYPEKIAELQDRTGLDEAVVVVSGRIARIKTVVAVMDSSFLMGSMGYVVGEKVTKAIEHATKRKYPLIIFTTSGGARMQEGVISLMQMAKTAGALKKHSEAGLLYVSYLTNPTYGGVTASFALLGDINLAEPGALIGFAGRRVIKSTIKQELPADFQTAEFMEKQGYIDMIVERKQMRETLVKVLKLHQGGISL